MHGGEVQLGELRFKLVSFVAESAAHKRARAYLAKRDGLTGLLTRDPLLKAIEEEVAYAEWVEAPLTLARYELAGRTGSCPTGRRSSRCSPSVAPRRAWSS
jgi:hypothetical protein